MQIHLAFPVSMALLMAQTQAPPALLAPPAATPIPQGGVVQSAAQAFDYRHLTSSTTIDFKGTPLMPEGMGWARIQGGSGAIQIKAKFDHLPPAQSFGPEFLTYVLWAIGPDGRANNLGELQVKHGKSRITVTESLPAFGLLVTAEPYFAVRQPSEGVVLENVLNKASEGKVEVLTAKFAVLPRGTYGMDLAAKPDALDPNTPLDVHQARNAMRIARAAGASAFAPEPFGTAQAALLRCEAEAGDSKARIASARSVIRGAEAARMMAVQRQAAERTLQEQQRAQAKLDQARAEAAMATASQTATLQQARMAEQETQDLRTQLMDQFNAILETKATARGLIVSLSGLLFPTHKATLAPEAREKLSKIAAILALHKGLKIEAVGFTDPTGNRRLSEQRSRATKDYLISQGVPAEAIVSRGFGEEQLLAANDADAGRQENRQVELVLTGEGIDAPKSVEP